MTAVSVNSKSCRVRNGANGFVDLAGRYTSLELSGEPVTSSSGMITEVQLL